MLLFDSMMDLALFLSFQQALPIAALVLSSDRQP